MKQNNQMLTGGILRPILAFFFPILVGAFFQQLYNTVDAIVVGQFAGTVALASVGGSAGQVTGFIFSFFMGLSTGATVIIAQNIGADRPKEVDIALHTAYTFGLIGGVILGVLGILFSVPLLNLLQTPADLMESSGVYMRILLGGLVFTLIYNMGSGILRAAGDSKRPLYILIVCCGVNIVLDILMVAVLHMGVMGAAIATDISQAVSAVLITWILCRHTQGMKLEIRKLRIDGRMLGKVLQIGFPTALAGSMFSVANMILQTSVNRMGVNPVAAWTAYGKVDSLWWMIDSAFSTSITTFVGQNYGARQPQRIRRGILEVLILEIVAGALMSALFIHFGQYILALFTDNKEVVSIGIMLAAIITPFYAIYAVNEVLAAALRAEGYVMFATIANLIGVFVFRIIWIKVIYPDGGMSQVMWCYPISWTLITIFVSIYYFAKQKKTLETIGG